MNSGIYQIRNTADGKRYIGRSNNIEKRWKMHDWELRSNRHFNAHLQNAYNLKPDAFVYEVIEKCDVDSLNERELYWIKQYQTMDMRFGYNLCEGGKSTTGRKCTEETRKKISEKKKGYKCKPEDIEKRTNSLKEHIKNDPEFAKYHHDYCAKGTKGKPSWNKGRKWSEESRHKLSLAQKGKKKVSDAHKEKLHNLYMGEKSLSAKLTEKEAIELKIRFLKGESRMDIARSFPKVKPQTIYDCVKGRRWKHLPNSIEELERLKNGTEVFTVT